MVIFAKSLLAANKLSESFKNRLTDKNYLSVLNGKIDHFETKFYHHMIEKTQNSKVRIFEISGKEEESMKKEKKKKIDTNDRNRKSKPSDNKNLKSSIELIDAKLYMNAVTVIQGGADKNNCQTLVNVALKTGRKHQIRAQMSHIGTTVRQTDRQTYRHRDVYTFFLPFFLSC